MMDIAGIDYSTHYIDIVRLREDNPPHWDRFELSGADSFDRCRTVGDHTPARYSAYWDNVLAVGIEEPAGRNTGHLFRIQGAVLSQIPARMLVEKWMPSQWRKAVGLPGNASKQDVATFVSETHYPGWAEKYAVLSRNIANPGTGLTWPQDACDAYCIALATQKALERQAA